MVLGLGVALGALGIRAGLRTYRNMQALSKLTGTSPFTHYYKGGFEQQMSRNEASLILGVR